VAPEDIARQVRACDPVPATGSVRAVVTRRDATSSSIDVTSRDRPGLLAHETAALAALGLDIGEAVAATWGDGCALASFRVHGTAPPDGHRLQTAIEEALSAPLTSAPLDAVQLDFDNDASPWHTVCSAHATDRRGLLNGLTSAFAAGGANVLAARVERSGGAVVGLFQLTDGKGRKLAPDDQERVAELVRSGVDAAPPRWRRRRGHRFRTRPSAAPPTDAAGDGDGAVSGRTDSVHSEKELHN
jgi:UTP:GlnB (protein PII) uridylyltransferase